MFGKFNGTDFFTSIKLLEESLEQGSVLKCHRGGRVVMKVAEAAVVGREGMRVAVEAEDVTGLNQTH